MRHIFAVGWAGVMLGLFAPLAFGQVSFEEAEARLNAKQHATTQPAGDELSRLREENASLRAQLVAATEEINRLRGVAKAPAPSAASANGRVAPGRLPPGGKFFAADEILTVIPTAMRPKPGDDWMPLHAEQVQQWCRQNLTGKSFDGALYIVEVPHTDPDYGLIMGCFNCMPETPAREKVGASVHPQGGQVRTLQDLKEGNRVHVSGSMRDFSVIITQTGGVSVGFVLDSATVKPDK